MLRFLHASNLFSISIETNFFYFLPSFFYCLFRVWWQIVDTLIPFLITVFSFYFISEFVDRFKGLRSTSWLRKIGANSPSLVCKLLLEDVMKNLTDEEKAKLALLGKGSKVGREICYVILNVFVWRYCVMSVYTATYRLFFMRYYVILSASNLFSYLICPYLSYLILSNLILFYLIVYPIISYPFLLVNLL